MGRQKRNMPFTGTIFRYWERDRSLLLKGMNRRTCFYCLWQCPEPSNLERAHIVARCDGGPDIAENLILLCHSCHVETDGWTQIDWGLFLLDRSRPYRCHSRYLPNNPGHSYYV